MKGSAPIVVRNLDKEKLKKLSLKEKKSQELGLKVGIGWVYKSNYWQESLLSRQTGEKR